MKAHPERREAQRALARDVTEMVHGPEQVGRAERAAGVLFGGSLAAASAEDILMVFEDAPSIEVNAEEVTSVRGLNAADLAVRSGLVPSKSEAGRLIKQGGLYVNDRRLSPEESSVTQRDAIDGRVIVLRKGQRERRIVRIRL
jgi:tyrosyl-tRNA synthetase